MESVTFIYLFCLYNEFSRCIEKGDAKWRYVHTLWPYHDENSARIILTAFFLKNHV